MYLEDEQNLTCDSNRLLEMRRDLHWRVTLKHLENNKTLKKWFYSVISYKVNTNEVFQNYYNDELVEN